MADIPQLSAVARHYLEIGRPAQALEALARPGAADPINAEFWYLRGQALYDLERYDEAQGAVQSGLSYAPESLVLLFLACNVAAQRGDLAAAEAAILTALRLYPEVPALLCRYALLVARAGQLEKAERLVAEAARIAPDDESVARARVALAHLRGDDRQVVRSSRDLLAVNPEDPFGHYMLGSGLFTQGQVSQGARAFQTAARIDPSDQDAVEAAREARFQNHWLLVPLRPFRRIGTIGTWFGFIAILLLLRGLGQNTLATIFALCYLVFCIYSWVVPWLLRKWLRRS